MLARSDTFAFQSQPRQSVQSGLVTLAPRPHRVFGDLSQLGRFRQDQRPQGKQLPAAVFAIKAACTGGPYDELNPRDQPHRDEDKYRKQKDGPSHHCCGLGNGVLLILACIDEESSRLRCVQEGRTRFISDERHSPDTLSGISHGALEPAARIFQAGPEHGETGNSLKGCTREKPGNHDDGDRKQVGQDLPAPLEREA